MAETGLQRHCGPERRWAVPERGDEGTRGADAPSARGGRRARMCVGRPRARRGAPLLAPQSSVIVAIVVARVTQLSRLTGLNLFSSFLEVHP